MPVISALWEAKVGKVLELKSLTSLGNVVKPHLYKKKISKAWWCPPLLSATQEAEAEESFEPKRQRLQLAEIMPLHSKLGNKSKTLSQINEQTNMED